MTKQHKRKRSHLQPNYSELQMIFILSEGNPSTLMIFSDLLHGHYLSCKFDFVLLCIILDSIGIYGSNITRLFYNYCYGDIDKFCNLIFNFNNIETLLKVKSYLKLK